LVYYCIVCPSSALPLQRGKAEEGQTIQ
jgi:hypothetical protein